MEVSLARCQNVKMIPFDVVTGVVQVLRQEGPLNRSRHLRNSSLLNKLPIFLATATLSQEVHVTKKPFIIILLWGRNPFFGR